MLILIGGEASFGTTGCTANPGGNVPLKPGSLRAGAFGNSMVTNGAEAKGVDEAESFDPP